MFHRLSIDYPYINHISTTNQLFMGWSSLNHLWLQKFPNQIFPPTRPVEVKNSQGDEALLEALRVDGWAWLVVKCWTSRKYDETDWNFRAFFMLESAWNRGYYTIYLYMYILGESFQVSGQHGQQFRIVNDDDKICPDVMVSLLLNLLIVSS